MNSTSTSTAAKYKLDDFQLQINYDYFPCINFVAISPDQTKILTASDGAACKIISITTPNVIHTISDHNGAVYCVACSPDGNLFASCGYDNKVFIYSCLTYKLLTAITLKNTVYCLCFSPDSQHLVVGLWTGYISFYSTKNYSHSPLFKIHSDRINTLRFDGPNTILTSSHDCTAKSCTFTNFYLKPTSTIELKGHERIASLI